MGGVRLYVLRELHLHGEGVVGIHFVLYRK
jgi:hypothetical protein